MEEDREGMVRAPRLAVSIVGGSGRHESGWVSEEGSFVIAARDAEAFSDQHPSISGAPMRVVNSQVLDRGDKAHITVTPPPGIVNPSRGGGKTLRRAMDKRQLTALGRAALARPGSRAKRGELGRDCVVWMVARRCLGGLHSPLCDTHRRVEKCNCVVREVKTATIQQVADEQITVTITGRHRAAGGWEPPGRTATAEQLAAIGAGHAKVRKLKEQQVRLQLPWKPTEDSLPAGVIARYKVLSKARLKQRSDRTSSSCGNVEAGRTVDALRIEGNRVQTAGGWLSIVATSGTVLLELLSCRSDTGAATHAPAVASPAAPSPQSPLEDALALGPATTQLAMVERRLGAEEDALAGLRAGARRFHPREDRDRIRQLTRHGLHAAKVQGIMATDAGDLQRAPELKYVQQVQKNARRQARNDKPPYEALDDLNRNSERCIFYQRSDPTAAENTREEMNMSVYSHVQLIDAGADSDAICLDTKWLTRSDGGCVHAGIGLKQSTTGKPGEPVHGAFKAGYHHHYSFFLGIALANLDCYFTTLMFCEAVDRMLPCTDPNCPHPVVRVETALGFYRKRDCRPVGPLHRKRRLCKIGIIDKHRGEARALRKLEMRMVLCAFHTYAAILEYLDKQLGVRDYATLREAVLCCKFLARSRTAAEASNRWTYVKGTVLPLLKISAVVLGKFVQYLEKHWLDSNDFWRNAWTDILRWTVGGVLRRMGATNNWVESFWIYYLAMVCNFSQFNRIDDEGNGITGHYQTLDYNLIDSLLLKMLDFDTAPTRIPRHVIDCLRLAHVLTLMGAVKRADDGPQGRIYYVAKGQAPAHAIQFGNHARRRVEFRLPETSRRVGAALTRYTRADFVKRGVPASKGFDVYCVDAEQGVCECTASMWAGPGGGMECKHLAAVRWREAHDSDAAALSAATLDLGEDLRKREKRSSVQEARVASGSNVEICAFVKEQARLSPPATSVETDSDPLDEMQYTQVVTHPREVAPKGPQSAYIRFCSSEIGRSRVKQDNPAADFAEVSRLVGQKWKELTEEQRQPFVEAAAAEKTQRAAEAARGGQPQPSTEAQPDEGEEAAAAEARTKPGPRPFLTKARHEWRSADPMRPTRGLKTPGSGSGARARQRVDASKRGREGR